MMENIELKRNMKIHLIGIAGSGLSAIARVLLESGYSVSGSDRVNSTYLTLLKEKGARIFIGHHSSHIQGIDLVVRSSAILDDNVEVLAARQAGIPVLKRADFLNHLIKDQICIAVAGTHGKTTTTAMISWVLSQLNQDPSFIVGSVIKGINTNARAGAGPYFVIEADEYDGMFLGLKPHIAVLTNLEYDHPDCYPSLENYRQAFLLFVGQIPANGVLLYCGDDSGAANIVSEASGVTSLSYGDATSCDYQASNLSLNDSGGFDFDVTINAESKNIMPVSIRTGLQIPGKHNVLNALAALAAVDQLNLSLSAAAGALASYQGTGRRFEILGEARGITVIDDYAHHPTEIRATLSAARAKYPGRNIWVVWQPHTYSRTRSLLPDYETAFADSDSLLITDIYAARETQPADGFSTKNLVDAIQHPHVQHAAGLTEAAQLLLKNLSRGDVLLVLSAGDADRISMEVFQALKKRNEEDE
jgi:UDP-N-acetylmuramate--alanine ligase